MAMPAALLAMWLIGVVVLHGAGLSTHQHGWYLPSLGALPFAAVGMSANVPDLMAYLEGKRIGAAEIIYREGEPADTVDLVAAGNLTVHVARGERELLRVRRITTHTVLGEMGFVRRSVRAATVSSDGPATIFTLTHESFERMRRERPDLENAFDDFIMRTLADRMEAANRAAAAMAG